MSFLVIGCGSIGKRHIGNLLTLGHKKIHVFTRSQERMEGVLEQFPEIIPIRDKSQLYADKRDVTLICTPPAHHLEYALMAAREKSHIFLEKPVSASLHGVDELLELVSLNQVRHMVAYNYRYWKSLQRVKEIVEKGDIGKVHSFRVAIGQYLPDWHPWEDYRDWFMSKKNEGGGILLDLTHAIDYIHWMFGRYEEVSGFIGTIGDFDITSDDYAVFTVKLKSGIIGTFHLDCLSRKPMNSLSLIGSEKSLDWSGLDNTIDIYDPESQETATEEVPMERNEMFLAEMQAFLEYVEKGGPSPNPIEEGLHALEVAVAAQVSSAEKGQMTPIQGNGIKRDYFPLD
jgi:predicted dehydrogenase